CSPLPPTPLRSPRFLHTLFGSSGLPLSLFFFNDTAPTEIYPLPLHDALPIWFFVYRRRRSFMPPPVLKFLETLATRSEEHTSELQSLTNLVCRLLREKKDTAWGGSATVGQSRRQTGADARAGEC